MKKLLAFLMVVPLFFSITCAHQLIDEALTHLDKPYAYATAGPKTFDCTGFTCYCYKTIYNIELKRSAEEQGYDDTYEKIESIDNLIIGDCVYFNTNRHDNDLSDHAGIYLGDGKFIHCSSAKGKVIISSLLEGFYNERFSWGRRIIQEEKENEHND